MALALLAAPIVPGWGGADPALAAMDSGVSKSAAPAGDESYAAGRAAFEQANWADVVRHMTEVVRRKPWHDDAYNALGFAYRQLGDYGRALSAYHRALQLNPHHRGALEYLGEAYLELGQPAAAAEILDRLRTACRRVAGSAESESDVPSCEEWAELNAAIARYQSTATE